MKINFTANLFFSLFLPKGLKGDTFFTACRHKIVDCFAHGVEWSQKKVRMLRKGLLNQTNFRWPVIPVLFKKNSCQDALDTTYFGQDSMKDIMTNLIFPSINLEFMINLRKSLMFVKKNLPQEETLVKGSHPQVLSHIDAYLFRWATQLNIRYGGMSKPGQIFYFFSDLLEDFVSLALDPEWEPFLKYTTYKLNDKQYFDLDAMLTDVQALSLQQLLQILTTKIIYSPKYKALRHLICSLVRQQKDAMNDTFFDSQDTPKIFREAIDLAIMHKKQNVFDTLLILIPPNMDMTRQDGWSLQLATILARLIQRHGDEDIILVQKILKFYPQLAQYKHPETSFSALAYACGAVAYGRPLKISFAKLLLEKGGNPALMQGTLYEQKSILYYAISAGEHEVVKLLLEYTQVKTQRWHLILKEKEKEKCFPSLVIASGFSFDKFQHFKVNLDILNTLVEAGADPNQGSTTGILPLEVAIQRGDLETCRWLIQHQAKADQTGSNDIPLILYACGYDQSNSFKVNYCILDELLRAGAHINAINGSSVSPLDVAIERGDADLCQYLINQKAMVDIRLLFHALGYQKDKGFVSHPKIMEKILLNKDGLLGQKLDKLSALDVVAKRKDFEIAQFLIEKGADLSSQDWFFRISYRLFTLKKAVSKIFKSFFS